MTGKIIKGIAGFYYVACEGRVYTCKAKGILRNRNIKPLIGDNVDFSVIDEEKLEGNIEDILPRSSSLIRPAVANVDFIIVVLAVAKPAPQLYLLDRYLVSMDIQDIPVVIVWNKLDLDTDAGLKYAAIYEKAGYRSFITSSVTGEGVDELKAYMKGHSAAFAGPSGVGKSSLTNILCPDAAMETNGISRKIERGRHTTRHSEFFVVDRDTYICDTPGFTCVAFEGLDKDEVRMHFPEIGRLEGKCRFSGCRHMAEPGCAVKESMENGDIPESRYLSYKKIYEETAQGRKY